MKSNKNPYEIDFEEYIRQGEPSKTDKVFAWSTAIGLQKVDGLIPSKYLFDIAQRNIDGEITVAEAKTLVDTYYDSKSKHIDESEERTEEADKVASRIARILSAKAFVFSPSSLIAIHGNLFEGIYKFAGKLRDYDISKHEWVLDGDSVMYAAWDELKDALNYDFEQERDFNYKGLNKDEIIKHIAFFVSQVWQIHAFGEGNTRTTAVFAIQYLRFLGFDKLNDTFFENSWYFRNALVRANYTNVEKGIQEKPVYLERFFRNLLLNESNELKNRYTHIDYDELAPTRAAIGKFWNRENVDG